MNTLDVGALLARLHQGLKIGISPADIDQAAKTILALEAERKRLEDALREIERKATKPLDMRKDKSELLGYGWMVDIQAYARAALTPQDTQP